MEKEKKIKKTEVIKNVFLLEFENQLDITSTFLRFQEHYESPEFRGKIFNLDEYKEWYIKTRGAFTYYTDWGGFNIPSYALKPFYESKFDPLSDAEKQILDLFKDHTELFYIIGIFGDNEKTKSILEHEIAHGLFYTEPEYKKKVLEILNKYDLEALKTWLRNQGGYHEEVLLDECHAYGINGSNKSDIFIDKLMRVELKELFEEWKKKRK